MKKQVKITILLLLFSIGLLAQTSEPYSCEEKIFSLDEDKSYYGGFTFLERICYDSTSLVWYDTIAPEDYKEHYRMFKELIQYETHFSGILEHFICRKYGRLGLPEEKHLPKNDRYKAWVLEVQYYYPYQCDTFINVVNRYQVTTTGHPTEEGAPVLYDVWDGSVFIFFDMFNFGDTGRDKLDIIRKRVMKLVEKY